MWYIVDSPGYRAALRYDSSVAPRANQTSTSLALALLAAATAHRVIVVKSRDFTTGRILRLPRAMSL
jgi:hypothetical protein